MDLFLGIDVGSVSTNFALINKDHDVIDSLYLRTQGQPIEAVKGGLKTIASRMDVNDEIVGVGTTGSARNLSGILVRADTIKNEITAHAVAAVTFVSDTQTVIEIGGQDSKIIIIRDQVAVDFAMNTVCAAGTGSFLDQQANRLNIRIEDFGDIALRANHSVRIAGRCTVFAESDMIHKQQLGYRIPEILSGLCDALVKNYLNNVAKGKDILPPVVFQGGVAANKGIKRSFENELGIEMIVPPHFNVMGAIGAAILASEKMSNGEQTRFRGFEMVMADYITRSFECDGCPNGCEIIEVLMDENVISRWGDRCGKWAYVEA
ncbi:MAG: acyl-CoA dehydratase activase [Actinobacteria bacterium]|nr:acyl-CoA dehydratase activase [Actinomycetota bacterium]